MSSFERISQRSLWMVASLGLFASAAFGGGDLTLTADCKGWELTGAFEQGATIVFTGFLFQTVDGNTVTIEQVSETCTAPPNNEPDGLECFGTWVTGDGELPFGEYAMTGTAFVVTPGDTEIVFLNFGPFGCSGPNCNLFVFKRGCVVPPPPATDACEGKVTHLTFRYTGEGCDATMHTQDPDKVTCEGDADDTNLVRILVTDKDGVHVYADVVGVPLEGQVLAAAENAGENHFKSSTRIRIFFDVDNDGIEDEIENVLFHTSCSQPLIPGNQFGSMFLDGMITTEGGEDTFEEPGDTCTMEFLITSGAECDGKVVSLQLRYTGGNCAQTMHSQDPDKVSCEGDTGTIQPVRILVTDKNGDRVYADVDNVPLDGVIVASAANAGQGKMKKSIKIRIFDAAPPGILLQEIEFHTSCSQPLELGDQFGAIQLFGMETTKGGSGSLGVEVDYTYTISNGSTLPLTAVLIIDDVFGLVPGSPPVIQPGETVVLTLQAIVTETTTNTVTVTGFLGDGDETCAVSSMETITAIEPPPGPEDCCESGNKLQQILVTYTGEGCDATMHSQKPNKVKCEGDPFGADAHIRATDRKNPNDTGGKIWFEGDVNVGEQFIIDANNAGKSKLKSKTYIHVFDQTTGDLLQTLKFHTSCSQPLFVGDQFGSIVIDGCTPEGGPSEGQFCVGGAKPSVLTMLYTGDGCSATQHSQDPGKVSCEGDADNTPLVRIRASDKEDPEATDARVWFDGLVVLDETFDIAAANAGKSKLKSKTWVHIFLGDTLLETIMFHTSCSQPLNQDDKFGSLTLVDFVAE